MFVKIYTVPTCSYCLAAKKFLNEHNINFEDIDISGDPQRIEEMVEKSGQMATPVLDINGQIILGFQKDLIRKALKI